MEEGEQRRKSQYQVQYQNHCCEQCWGGEPQSHWTLQRSVKNASQICLPAPTNVRLGIYPPPSAGEVGASIHWLPSSILEGCPRAMWRVRVRLLIQEAQEVWA